MTSKLVLQINSLDALERLIGGDAEVEVELRNNIAAKFAEKHLKQLANSDVVMSALTRTEQALRVLVQDQVTRSIATVKDNGYYGLKIESVRPEIKTAIDAAVQTSIDSVVHTSVQEAIAKLATQELIEKKVTREAATQLNERVTAAVKKRIDVILAEFGK